MVWSVGWVSAGLGLIKAVLWAPLVSAGSVRAEPGFMSAAGWMALDWAVSAVAAAAGGVAGEAFPAGAGLLFTGLGLAMAAAFAAGGGLALVAVGVRGPPHASQNVS